MPDIPPRQLITSLYGLYGRTQQGLSVASLVRMMAELGVDAAAVRSSVSRLKRRDVLRSTQVAGRAGYALAPSALEMLREGDRRIFSRPRATAEDGWLVVVFSVPESEREKRHALRSQLARLGFGTVAPGVWVAPGTLHEETVRAFDRLSLTAFTEFFRGAHLGPGDVSSRVGTWWDLGELESLYQEFLDRYEAAGAGGADGTADPGSAFRAYVPMLTQWRRLPYLDPGLPLDHLPDDWPGVRAGDLFATVDARLREPAEKHARSMLAEPPG